MTKVDNQAFKKMRRRGIVTPTIAMTDKTTRTVAELYNRNLKALEKEIKDNLGEYNVQQSKPGVIVKDSMLGLVNYLKALGANNPLSKEIIGNVKILINKNEDIEPYKKLKARLNNQFGEASDHFFKDFFEDADDRLIVNIVKYKLDKNEVFQARIDDIRELYVNNAIERINGEQNDLKRQFLDRLTKWITGEAKELKIADILTGMKKTAVSESRFFARDQFCKFNKALLISSFRAAGVKRVRLITCKDAAVRKEHQEWNNKEFEIDEIPKEWWNDYNCRCGAIALWED
jgi:hypothetical protein